MKVKSKNKLYDRKNVLYSKNQKDLVTVLYQIQGSFTVNNKVENILDYAFHNQHQMTQIVILEGVKEIGISFNISQINIDKKEGTTEGALWGATKGMKVVNWKK